MVARDNDVDVAATVADTALRVLFATADDQASVYHDYVLAALSDAARKALEMLPLSHEYKDEGLRRAKAEGEATGRAEGLALGLIDVLEARHLDPTPEQWARILATSDADQLRRWLQAAVGATSAADVLRA